MTLFGVKECCEVAAMFGVRCLDCNPVKRNRTPKGETKAKNLCGKTVTRDKAYEVWQSHDGTWTWYVRKKWQTHDYTPNARWYCDVVTPIVPEGETGDVYVSEIKKNAVRIK